MDSLAPICDYVPVLCKKRYMLFKPTRSQSCNLTTYKEMKDTFIIFLKTPQYIHIPVKVQLLSKSPHCKGDLLHDINYKTKC
jgi:hypothetical protein